MTLDRNRLSPGSPSAARLQLRKLILPPPRHVRDLFCHRAGARATPPGDVTALLASRPGDPPSLVFRRVRRPLSGTKVFAGSSLRLTELSNVVAYVCRSLQRKNRHHVHSLSVPSSRPHRSRWISRYRRCKTVLVELHAIRAGSPGFLGGGSSPPPRNTRFQSAA